MTPGTQAMALALVAALFFGATSNIVRRGLSHVDPQTGSMISIGSSLACYALVSPFWFSYEDLTSPAALLFAANGLIHPIFSRYLAYEANQRIGPTVSATLSATTPLFGAAIAISWLGERLNLPLAVGTLTVMGGVMALSWQGGRIGKLAGGALLFATGAAAIRGLNNNVTKFALTSTPNPLMGTFITFLVSFCLSLVLYRVRSGGLPRKIPANGLLWCGAAGVVSAVAVGCVFAALSIGQVVLVSPVVTTYPFFTLITALLIRQERLTARLALGVSLVVAGVMLVGLSSRL